MNEAEESRKETNGASAKRVVGMIGLIIGMLVFLLIGIVFFMFILQVNPLARLEFELYCGAGPIGQIFVDAVESASDSFFGWI